MSYVIKHKNRGVYTKHELVPRFRRKRKREEWKTFTAHDAAKAVMDMPGMEDCTIEPMKEQK